MGNVINMIGGGKPEEEKTVTAGTSAIVVNPSSGKVMKKVTVNPTPTESKEVTAGTEDITVSPTEGKHISGVTVHPTPSQEKTVIPTAEGFKVSPDKGKLLSAVFVDGDGDLVAENIKQGINIFGVLGNFNNNHGLYVWKKLTAQGGDFIDFVVSDSETSYPDGGIQGGYWYEKVVGGVALEDFGCTKIAVDKFTLSSDTNVKNGVTINHSLGTKPKIGIIVAYGTVPEYYIDLVMLLTTYSSCMTITNCVGESTANHVYYDMPSENVTTTNYKYTCNDSRFLARGIEYGLITMA